MLATMIGNWSSLYSDHALLRTTIGFLHIGGLLVGGGTAIAADRWVLTRRNFKAAARDEQIRSLESAHSVVVGGLAFVIVSGLLLLGADLETYLYSTTFWLKMGLLGLLSLNGGSIVMQLKQARNGDDGAWLRLHERAMTSLILWLTTTFAGMALPNI